MRSPHRLRRTVAGALLLALALGLCRAEGGDAPPPKPKVPTPAEASDTALAAFQRKDGEALAVLASASSPDVWSVADWLVLRGCRLRAPPW